MIKIQKKRKIKLPLKTSPKKLDFDEHLQELKNRFLIWFGFFCLASIVSYFFYQPLLDWLMLPLASPLFYTSPVGALQAVFGVSFLFGFIIALPVFLYQVVRFVEPASKKELTGIFIYVVISFLLALAGILVAYYLVLPATLRFLADFAVGKLQALISTQDYFSFIIKYFLAFAVFFQLPLVVYILSQFISLSAKTLLKYWRHVFALSFLASAIMTPTPDFINQTIMAIPIILLYFISILVLAIANKWHYNEICNEQTTTENSR